MLINVCNYCDGEVEEKLDIEVAVCSECGAVEPDTREMTEEEYEKL
jgi:hypothetical protein